MNQIVFPKLNSSRLEIQTLRNIQNAGFSSAIIAGGFVRDLYLYSLHRDIDIYLWDPKFSNERGVDSSRYVEDILKEALGFNETPNTTNTTPKEYFVELGKQYGYVGFDAEEDLHINREIVTVYEALKNYNAYQLILTKIPPIQFVEQNFDVELSKAYCDGTRIRYTSGFIRDATNQTITISGKYSNKNEYGFAIEYAQKIAERFPHFTIQPAPHNEQYHS